MREIPRFVAAVVAYRNGEKISLSTIKNGDYVQAVVSEVFGEKDGTFHGVLRGSAYTIFPNTSTIPALGTEYESRLLTELPKHNVVTLRRTGILFWRRHVAELTGDQHLSVVYNPVAFRGHRVKLAPQSNDRNK